MLWGNYLMRSLCKIKNYSATSVSSELFQERFSLRHYWFVYTVQFSEMLAMIMRNYLLFVNGGRILYTLCTNSYDILNATVPTKVSEIRNEFYTSQMTVCTEKWLWVIN